MVPRNPQVKEFSARVLRFVTLSATFCVTGTCMRFARGSGEASPPSRKLGSHGWALFPGMSSSLHLSWAS